MRSANSGDARVGRGSVRASGRSARRDARNLGRIPREYHGQHHFEAGSAERGPGWDITDRPAAPAVEAARRAVLATRVPGRGETGSMNSVAASSDVSHHIQMADSAAHCQPTTYDNARSSPVLPRDLGGRLSTLPRTASVDATAARSPPCPTSVSHALVVVPESSAGGSCRWAGRGVSLSGGSWFQGRRRGGSIGR